MKVNHGKPDKVVQLVENLHRRFNDSSLKAVHFRLDRLITNNELQIIRISERKKLLREKSCRRHRRSVSKMLISS